MLLQYALLTGDFDSIGQAKERGHIFMDPAQAQDYMEILEKEFYDGKKELGNNQYILVPFVELGK